MKYIISFVFGSFVYSAVAQTAWRKVSEEMVFKDAPFTECHASTITETAPGKFLVAFFGGSEEGAADVAIWLAAKENNQWGKVRRIADGRAQDSLQLPCWNPVLFKSQQGKLFLFYKVGPRPTSWWGMMTSSVNNGASWAEPQRLAVGILGPIKNKPVQLTDGTILSGSSTEDNGRWKVHMERSADQGNSWEKIPIDTGNTFKVIQPTILTYPGGRIQILCRSNQDKLVQSWSNDQGSTWEPLTILDVPNPNSGIDAVTLQNGWQLLVYNPLPSGKEWFNNRGKLQVAVSKDGIHWKDVVVLEDSNQDEFSYPAVIQASDGKVHITYTYKRRNIKHVVLSAGARNAAP